MKIGDPHEVGRLMKERRLKLGYTQVQMAKALGIHPITLLRLELGRVGYIHASTAKKLEVPVRMTNRLVMEPAGVMRDGSIQPLEHPEALPPEMQAILTSGDVEALPPKNETLKRRGRPSKTLYSAPERRVPKPSLRKRLFLWLAGA